MPRPVQPWEIIPTAARADSYKPCRTSERSRRGRTLNARTAVAANELCSAASSLRRRSTTSPGPGKYRPSAPFAAAENCVDRSRCDRARNLADHVGGRRRSLWERLLQGNSCRPMMHRNDRLPPLNRLRTLLPEWSWTALSRRPRIANSRGVRRHSRTLKAIDFAVCGP